MLPLVAGGDLGGVCWGAGAGRCGVDCDEKRELMLFIHDGLLDWRGSSLLLLFSVLTRLSRLGRLLDWFLFGVVDEGGVGVVGTAGSEFCFGCDSDGGVTCEGALCLLGSDGVWLWWVWAGRSPLVEAGGLVSFVTEEVDEACLRCWFS